MRSLAVVLLFALAYAKHEKYNGWKSYYVGPASAEQLSSLGPLLDKYSVDVLSHPIVQREGVVLVAPKHQADFTKALEGLAINYKVHAEDVKA
ncbi:carboxypeptidase B-like [Leguminivora glycinivorella]|nr:carboxypeptidase B-like [Leguminivora glycinivorella]